MIRRAIVWTVSGQIVVFGATFAMTVILTRILSPREIGMFAIGAAVSGALQALAAFGVGTYVVREHELTPTILSTAFTINALTACLLALTLAGASFVPSITMHEPLVAIVLRVLAVVPLIGIFEFRPATMLQRDMEFATIATVTVARTGATAVISIVSALAGASAVSAALGGLAGAVTGAVMFAIAARRHNSLSVTVAGWRPMVAFGFQTLAIGGVAVIAFRLSDFILGAILGLAALGYYNRAAALSGVPVLNIYSSLARVLFVKLADDVRAGRGVQLSYLRGLNMILAVLWPMLGGLAILSWPIVSILFGNRWLVAATPLAILAVGQMIALTFAMNYELFVLNDEVGRQAKLESIRTGLGLAIFAYGCTFGIGWAAAARLIDPIIGMIVYLPHIRRLSGTSMSALFGIYGRNLLILIGALAAPALVLLWTGDPSRISFPVLGLGLVGSAAGWLWTLRTLRHPLWDEITRIMVPVMSARKV